MSTTAAADAHPDFVSAPPFFIPSERASYRNPRGTRFLVRVRSNDLSVLTSDDALAANWRTKQEQFIEWTRDNVMFNEADVSYNHANFERYFAAEPRLRGCVLDVGGGWGLFRQWWDPDGPGDCFVVHDPGVERFMAEPHPILKRYYAGGLAKPAWFVEGFGEHLPYQDGKYEMVLIAAALDHCANPQGVLAESARVLKQGGELLIIEGCDAPEGSSGGTKRSLLTRVGGLLSDPRRLHRAIRQRLFHRGDPHLHHFTRPGLRQMMATAGFGRIVEQLIDESFGVYAFRGLKVDGLTRAFE